MQLALSDDPCLFKGACVCLLGLCLDACGSMHLLHACLSASWASPSPANTLPPCPLQAEAVIEVLRDKDPEEKVLIFSE